MQSFSDFDRHALLPTDAPSRSTGSLRIPRSFVLTSFSANQDSENIWTLVRSGSDELRPPTTDAGSPASVGRAAAARDHKPTLRSVFLPPCALPGIATVPGCAPLTVSTSFTVRVDDGAEMATRTFIIAINAAVTLAITLPGPTGRTGTLEQFYFSRISSRPAAARPTTGRSAVAHCRLDCE